MGACKTNRRMDAVGLSLEFDGAPVMLRRCPGYVAMVCRSYFDGVPVIML